MSQGIGGPDGPWMIMTRVAGLGMHRLRIRDSCQATPEAAQAKLDAYARRNGWFALEGGNA